MIKATFGGATVEIWFTPSFNIKTDDKDLEVMLRRVTVETYDPWRKKIRTVKATSSERDAYLLLSQFKTTIPELEITFKEKPEFEYHKEETPINY